MIHRHVPLSIVVTLLVAMTTGEGAGTAPAVPLVVAQVPVAALPGESLADGTLRIDPGEGGRLVSVDAAGRVRVLTRGFESAADPDISFDGRRVLFAGRRTRTDPWCAWEIGIDGAGARAITCGAAGVRHPIYQSIIYTITATGVEPWVQIAFTGVNAGERNEAGVAANTSLWSCRTDGTALRRLTFNLSNDMDPTLLPDGRMVYAGWLRHAAPAGGQGRVALLGVNEDGTDFQTYAGDQGLRVRQMPVATTSGLVVFVESDRLVGDGGGRLASVSQARPLHSYRALSDDTGGRFRSPAPLPDGRVLVAWRAGAQDRFAIHRMDPTTGAHEPVFDAPGWHSTEAHAAIERHAPDARSSVVQDDDAEGTIFTVDVNINDLGAAFPRGTAKAVRVVEGVAATADQPARRRVLGEVPLAKDGSYQVKVPANTPVLLQLLDEQGLALRSSAWLWVRNHATQGCVGCHEDPERTPPNRLMDALASPAPSLTAPAPERRTVTWADVQPIVAKRCQQCHAPGGSPPTIADVGGVASYVAGHDARRSPLVWHLLGKNTSRPWDGAASGRPVAPMPASAGTLLPAEIRTLIEWIDLGGQR